MRNTDWSPEIPNMNALNPGDPLLFMKVGKHANESLESILVRKRQEIDRGGFAMWGYGGNTCHPLSMVRPFAMDQKISQKPIRLVMQVMNSKHFAEQIAADEYTTDGQKWEPIDTRVHRVLGSRYALFIANLRVEAISLPLTNSVVALGPSEGKRGNAYVQGRVDKACLLYKPLESVEQEENPLSISLVADLVEPFAAILRNKLV